MAENVFKYINSNIDGLLEMAEKADEALETAETERERRLAIRELREHLKFMAECLNDQIDI